MELTYTDIIYLVFALNKVLQTDMSQIDKAHYENLLYRLKISEKGKKIRQSFGTSAKEWMEKNVHERS